MVESIKQSPFYQAQEKIEKWLYGKPWVPNNYQQIRNLPGCGRWSAAIHHAAKTLSFMEITMQEVKLISYWKWIDSRE